MRASRFAASPLGRRALLVAAFAFAPVAAGSQARNDRDVGIIVAAHGADAEWNAPVEALVAELAARRPTRVAYLMGAGAATNSFADAVTQLESLGVREIVVVPLLVSSHSSHYRQIEWLAGKRDTLDAALAQHVHHAGMRPTSARVPLRITRALDDAASMAEILSERAAALTATPREQALFLVAHGPNDSEDYAHWMDNLRRVAAGIREKTGFRDVRVDAVRDDAPRHVRAEAVRRVRELIEMQHTITQRDVVVVPILVSRGKISRSTLVADLSGLPIVYSGDPLLPHQALARWVEIRVREATLANDR